MHDKVYQVRYHALLKRDDGDVYLGEFVSSDKAWQRAFEHRASYRNDVKPAIRRYVVVPVFVEIMM